MKSGSSVNSFSSLSERDKREYAATMQTAARADAPLGKTKVNGSSVGTTVTGSGSDIMLTLGSGTKLNATKMAGDTAQSLVPSITAEWNSITPDGKPVGMEKQQVEESQVWFRNAESWLNQTGDWLSYEKSRLDSLGSNVTAADVDNYNAVLEDYQKKYSQYEKVFKNYQTVWNSDNYQAILRKEAEDRYVAEMQAQANAALTNGKADSKVPTIEERAAQLGIPVVNGPKNTTVTQQLEGVKLTPEKGQNERTAVENFYASIAALQQKRIAEGFSGEITDEELQLFWSNPAELKAQLGVSAAQTTVPSAQEQYDQAQAAALDSLQPVEVQLKSKMDDAQKAMNAATLAASEALSNAASAEEQYLADMDKQAAVEAYKAAKAEYEAYTAEQRQKMVEKYMPATTEAYDDRIEQLWAEYDNVGIQLDAEGGYEGSQTVYSSADQKQKDDILAEIQKLEQERKSFYGIDYDSRLKRLGVTGDVSTNVGYSIAGSLVNDAALAIGSIEESTQQYLNTYYDPETKSWISLSKGDKGYIEPNVENAAAATRLAEVCFTKAEQATQDAKTLLADNPLLSTAYDLGTNAATMAFDAVVGLGMATLTGGASAGMEAFNAARGFWGLASMATRVVGQSGYEAQKAGANYSQALGYGIASAGVEVMTERMFDAFAGIYGAGEADELVTRVIESVTDNPLLRMGLEFLVQGAGEGIEEVVSDLFSPLNEYITYNKDVLKSNPYNAEEMAYSFITGALLGLMGMGGQAAMSIASTGTLTGQYTGGIDTSGMSAAMAQQVSRTASQQLREQAADAADSETAFTGKDRLGKLAAKYGKKGSDTILSNQQAYRLMLGLQQADAATISTVAAEQLKANGFTGTDADAVARAIAQTMLESNTANAEGTRYLEAYANDPAVQQTMYDLSGFGRKTSERTGKYTLNAVLDNYRNVPSMDEIKSGKYSFNAETGTYSRAQAFDMQRAAGTGFRAAQQYVAPGSTTGTYVAGQDVLGQRTLASQQADSIVRNKAQSFEKDGKKYTLTNLTNKGTFLLKAEDGSSLEVRPDSEVLKDDPGLVALGSELKRLGSNAAEAYVHYEAGQNVHAYTTQLTNAINIASGMSSYQTFAGLNIFDQLTQAQKDFAWKAGQQQRLERMKAEAEQSKANAETVKGAPKNVRRQFDTSLTASRNVSFEGGMGMQAVDVSKLSKTQKQFAHFVKALSTVCYGINFHMGMSETNTFGAHVGNDIYINLNSGELALDVNTAIYTLSHELTHEIEQINPEAYRRLSDRILEILFKDDARGLEAAIETQKNMLSKGTYDGKTWSELSPEEQHRRAQAEVVANACAKMLKNSAFATRLAAEDRTVAGWVKKTLNSIFTRLSKVLYSQGVPTDKVKRAQMQQAWFGMDLLTEYEDVQQMWDDAMYDAAKVRNAQLSAAKFGKLDGTNSKVTLDTLSEARGATEAAALDINQGMTGYMSYVRGLIRNGVDVKAAAEIARNQQLRDAFTALTGRDLAGLSKTAAGKAIRATKYDDVAYMDALLDRITGPAFTEAAKNASTNADGDVQYEIWNVDGEDVVWIEDNVLDYIPENMSATKYIQLYIRDKLASEGDFIGIVKANGDVIYAEQQGRTRKSEYGLDTEYARSKYTAAIFNSKEKFSAKLRLAAHLNEAVETAGGNPKLSVVLHDKNKDAKFGELRYPFKMALEVKDTITGKTHISAFSAELLVNWGRDQQRYLYDVIDIKNDTKLAAAVAQKMSSRKTNEGRPTDVNKTISPEAAESKKNLQKQEWTEPEFSRPIDRSYYKKSLDKYGEVEKAAIEHFGLTDNFRLAGYILSNGSMLDFSGAHWLEGRSAAEIAKWRKSNDIRQVDHEDIFEAFEQASDDFPSDSRKEFINRGNVRVSPEAPGINISSEPTAAQYDRIRQLIEANPYNAEGFYVDIEKKQGRTAEKLTYEGKVNADRVINDIKHYYQTGQVRQQSTVAQFHTQYQQWDSEGNELSEAQQEYFKDSAIRDENGNLMVVYHGTNQGNFNEFLWDKTQRADGGFYGRGHYFTSIKSMAENYGERIISSYLNIKNPFVWKEQINTHKGNILATNFVSRINMARVFPSLFADNEMEYGVQNQSTGEWQVKSIKWSNLEAEINKTMKTLSPMIYGDGGVRWSYPGKYWDEPIGDKYTSMEEAEKYKFEAAIHAFVETHEGIARYMSFDDQTTYTQRFGSEITDLLKEMGYDGAMLDRAGEEIVAFESNQIKNIDNKNPTESNDIRFQQWVNESEAEPEVMSNAEGKTVSIGNGDNVQFSMFTYRNGGREQLSTFLDKRVQAGAISETEAAEMKQQMEEMYSICEAFAERYSLFGEWSEAQVAVDPETGNAVFSVVKANGEYAMNLDFSLVCKKRRTLDAVFNQMIEQGLMDSFEMKEGSIAAINEIIRENNFETACALCFVDAKRYRQALVADSFVKLYNPLVRSMAKKGQIVDFFNFGGDKRFLNSGVGIDTLPDSELDFTRIDQILADETLKGKVIWKIAKDLKENPQDRRAVLRGDFMSTAGFDNLKQNNGRVLSLYNSKKGAGGPKAAQSDVQYLNEIIKDKMFTAEKAYSVGGVRIQSFSDYVPRLVFDYLQMIADLNAKQLPAHAYTKEPMFALQFGLTGIKTNMSLVPAVVEGGKAPGLDADGNYAWKDGQSFGSTVYGGSREFIRKCYEYIGKAYDGKADRLTAAEGFELAKAIQRAAGYTENCGTIAVGISHDHIIKLLNDPDIRMVIPYHKSSLNHIVGVMENIDKYVDYTKAQNTRGPDGKKLAKGLDTFNYNEVLQRTGDAKAAADEYLRWCKENGYTPKFDEFAGEANYYKLLEDFSCYDEAGTATAQGGVKLTLPGEGSAFGTMKDFIRMGLEEDALLQAKQDAMVPEIVRQIQTVLPGVEKQLKAAGKSKKAVTAVVEDMRAKAAGTEAQMQEWGGSDNFKWALDDNVLTKQDQAVLWSKISDIRDGNFVEQTPEGEYIVYSDATNKVIFTDGEFRKPSISEVIEIISNDPHEINAIKRTVIDNAIEGIPNSETLRTIDEIFGKKCSRSDKESDYDVNGWENGRRKRKDGRTVPSNAGEESAQSNLNPTGTEAQMQQWAEADELAQKQDVEALAKLEKELRQQGSYDPELVREIHQRDKQLETLHKQVVKLQNDITKARKNGRYFKQAEASRIAHRFINYYYSQLSAEEKTAAIAAVQELGDYFVRSTVLDFDKTEELANKAAAIITDGISYFGKGTDGVTKVVTDYRSQTIEQISAEITDAVLEYQTDYSNETGYSFDRKATETNADRLRSEKKKYDYAWDRIGELQEQLKQARKEHRQLVDQLESAELGLDRSSRQNRNLRETLASERADFKAQLDSAVKQQVDILNEMNKLIRNKDRYEEQLVHKLDVKMNELERVRKARDAKYAKLEAKRTQQVSDLKARYNERDLKRTYKDRVGKLMADLNRKLQHPTERNHVPQSMIKQTVEVLNSINQDSGRSERLREKLLDIKAQYEALANSEDIEAAACYDEVVTAALDSMVKAVGDTPIAKMTSAQLEKVFDALTVMNHVITEAVKVEIGEKEYAAYQVSTKMIGETRSIDKAKANVGSKWLNASLSPERMFNRLGNYSKDSMWGQVYRMLDEGQLKMTRIMMESTRMFEGLMNDRRYADLTSVKPADLVDVGLVDENGNAILITKGMLLSLCMHLQNEDNSKHLARGGLTLPDLKEYYRHQGDRGFGTGRVRAAGISKELSEAGHAVSEAEKALAEAHENNQVELYDDLEAKVEEAKQAREEIIAKGDEYVMKLMRKAKQLINSDSYLSSWIKQLQEYYDVYSKNTLNEATEKVYGIKKAGVEHYFPISTDSNFLQAPFESIVRDMSLENVGFMKERNYGANPMYLFDVTDVLSRSIRNTARYAGMMPAIRNFNKVFQKTQTGWSDSLKNAITDKFGKDGIKYIDNLMQDLNGAKAQDSGTLGALLSAVRGNMAQANLTLSVRTALSQTASYPTAAAVVGWKALNKALMKGGKDGHIISRADQELIAKYSPLLWFRMQGYSTVELGDLEANKAQNVLWRKMRWMTGWIQAMDGATVGRLWYAAEYAVQERQPGLKKGSDEYYQEVAKLFNEVVEKTQPNYTTLQRPDILRNKNELVKNLTMFLTQRLQNFNILYDACATYSKYKGDYKKGLNGVTAEDVAKAALDTRRAVTSQLAAAATITCFKFLADVLLHSMKNYRDDEDGELDWFGGAMNMELLDMFMSSLAGNFLWGTEAYEFGVQHLIEGKNYYGIEVSSISTVTDMIDAFDKLANAVAADKTKEGYSDAVKKQTAALVKKLAVMGGIPVGNAQKIIEGLLNHVKDAANGEFFSFEAGYEYTTAQNTRRLYDAVMAGDEEKAGKVKELFKTEDEAESKLVSYIANKYVNEKTLDRDQVVELLVSECGYTQKEAEKKALQLTCELDTGIKYSNIRQAYLDGKITEEQANDMLKKYGGKTEDEAAETVTRYNAEKDTGISYSEAPEAYVNGRMTDAQAEKYLITYGDYTAAEAKEKVLQWKCEKDLGYSYSDVKKLFLSGKITENTVTGVLVKYGGKTREQAAETLTGYKCEKACGYSLNNLKEAVQTGKLNAVKAQTMRVRYAGDTAAEARAKVAWWQYEAANPGTKLNESSYTKYSTTVASTGISAKAYEKIRTTVDADGNGGISMKEAAACLKPMVRSGEITVAQANAMWKSFNKGWKKTFSSYTGIK